MASTDFKHESIQDAQSIAKYLRALIEGIESGKLDLGNDEAELELHPQGLLGLQLRAKRAGERGKLQFKLSWREPSPSKRNGTLKMGT